MEALLERFGDTNEDEVELWAALVDHVRPARASNGDEATAQLRSLTDLLVRRQDLAETLCDSLVRLFGKRRQLSLYVSSGLLPSTGFFSEAARRISDRLLPDVIDTTYTKDVLTLVFHRTDDEMWVNAIPDEDWIDFLRALFGSIAIEPAGKPGEGKLPHALEQIVEALRVLAYHVSAIGLEPELIRVDPSLEEHKSPFLAQNEELLAFLDHYRVSWDDGKEITAEQKHLEVMLDQCAEVVQRIRKRAAKIGTSFTLTFKLERLRQHLERIGVLLDLLQRLHAERRVAAVAPQIVALFKELVRAECRKNKLSDYWRQNVELLALRMTESAGKTGEHYIASNRSEYFGIFRSAALGGLIIALMTAFKIVLGRQGLAPLTGALAICLNYAIGFVVIHILGGTVATKQPAMTANAIAASIGESQGKTRNLENLVEIIARTIRSQLGAIVGNVGVAVPTAMLMSLAIAELTGTPFISEEAARSLLDQVDPLSPAVLFAAIAGVCLFLSGLIAGYYDNLSAYGRIPERLGQLRWTRRVFGETRMQRVAAYVEKHLGALAANFFFGLMLGGVTALGVLLGLPLDIRHIAFSSANVGYAAAGLHFDMSWQVGLLAAVGVALIGLTNLAVSFALTLYVALRSRSITFAQGRHLGMMILQRFLSHPGDFLLPPPASPPPPPAEPGEVAGDDAETVAKLRDFDKDALGQRRMNG